VQYDRRRDREHAQVEAEHQRTQARFLGSDMHRNVELLPVRGGFSIGIKDGEDSARGIVGFECQAQCCTAALRLAHKSHNGRRVIDVDRLTQSFSG